MESEAISSRGVDAYRANLRLLTELLPQMSGLLWSQGLEPYLDSRMDPSVSRPMTAELRTRIETCRKELLRRRDRIDPMIQLFREWAEAELNLGGEVTHVVRKKIGTCRQKLEFSAKEITALVWSKHTVSELVLLACLGDDRSIVRLVELDKVFVTARFTRDRIRQAQGREDREFFRRLARGIERDAYREETERSKLGIACYLLWFLGFERLGKRRLLNFVEAEGLASYPDPKSFDRFLSRIGLRVQPNEGDRIRG